MPLFDRARWPAKNKIEQLLIHQIKFEMIKNEVE